MATWLLLLRDIGTEANGHEAPPGRRLTRLLRYALRGCGFRTVENPIEVIDSRLIESIVGALRAPDSGSEG